MKVIREWPLNESLLLAEVSEFPKETYKVLVRKHLAPEYPILPWREYLDDKTASRLTALKNNLSQQYELRLAVLKQGELVGWTYGWQDSVDQASFFMGASLVLPELRRKGVYTALVRKTMELTTEAGFQSIWSMHVATNNPVIIAKLKMGFMIHGLEINALYGTLVKLVYHGSDLRARAARFRAGAVGESDIRDLLVRQLRR